jgi:hypothetical protein
MITVVTDGRARHGTSQVAADPLYRSAAARSTLTSDSAPARNAPIQGAGINPYHAVACRRGRL